MSIAPAPDLRVEGYLPGERYDGLHPQPPPAALLDGAIHIWILPQHDASTAAGLSQFESWRELLSTDEVERAGRFHFARHSEDFVVNRARLRMLLGLYLGQPADRVRFSYSPLGKPSLVSPNTALSFNLSHTDGLAVLAIAKQRQIGIDVEKISTAKDSLDIAQDYFSPREIRALEGYTNPDERRAAFLRCWTRKEAFLKAIGDGLSRPLSDFSVSCDLDSAELLDCSWDPTVPAHWSLFSLDVGDSHIAAVSYKGAPLHLQPPMTTFTWSQTL